MQLFFLLRIFQIYFILNWYYLLKYITRIIKKCSISATSSSTITDTGIGTGSSLLEMQITREELGATFTCKVNSIALVEPLTVDIKPDVHGEYTHSRITVGYLQLVKKNISVNYMIWLYITKTAVNIFNIVKGFYSLIFINLHSYWKNHFMCASFLITLENYQVS